MTIPSATLLSCPLPSPDERHVAPPQGLLAVGARLEDCGIPCSLIESCRVIPAAHFGTDALAALMVDKCDDIIGISVWDSNLPFVVVAARKAKTERPNLKVLLGGPAASALGGKLLSRFEWIDGVATGEGETSILEAFSGLSGATKRPDLLPSGVWMRQTGMTIEGTGPRSLLHGDQIPPPSYSLVTGMRFGRIELSTSRGCPFGCLHCSASNAFGRTVRAKTRGSIESEVQKLRDLGLRSEDCLHILDDCFLSLGEHARGVISILSNLPGGQGYSCYARLEDLTSENVRFLCETGCQGIFVGIPSGSDGRATGLSVMNGRIKIMRDLLDASMEFPVMASMIWGFPDESLETFNENVSFCLELLERSQSVAVSFYQLAPLSGTHYANNRELEFVVDDVSPFVYPTHLSHLAHETEILGLIKQHPDVFSGFFRVPTSDFRRKKSRLAQLAKEMEEAASLATLCPQEVV